MVVDASSSQDSFTYEFVLDKNGDAVVTITFSSRSRSDSTWVLVPRFIKWSNRSIGGRVVSWSLLSAESLIGRQIYFYEAFYFSFESDGSQFSLIISYNFSSATMIIEPDAIFYSPQIGFKEGKLNATVIFPEGFSVKPGQALALGSYGSYRPSRSGQRYVTFTNIPAAENIIRLEVGLKASQKADMITLKDGVFTFNTVSRYQHFAEQILNLFNRTYGILVDLFNVTLESANVKFFLPDFNYLLSIMGYVPFSSNQMGDIHINIFSIRFVEGYMEVTALHELIHHFLWRAGISPQKLLWFHEGIAQYISIHVADSLGFEGVSMIKEDLEAACSQALSSTGGNLGFLTRWTPSNEPKSTEICYAASYYIVNSLAEKHGDLDFYSRFFRMIGNASVDENSMLVYYLSLAAGRPLVQIFNDWGFDLPLIQFTLPPMFESVKKIIDQVNPLYQPFKFLAEYLFRLAVINSAQENSLMKIYLAGAILLARLSPILMLLMVSGILYLMAILVLKWRGVFSKP